MTKQSTLEEIIAECPFDEKEIRNLYSRLLCSPNIRCLIKTIRIAIRDNIKLETAFQQVLEEPCSATFELPELPNV